MARTWRFRTTSSLQGIGRRWGCRLVEGRDFDERDRFDPADVGKEPTVAIVNRRFAERFFGTRSAIGRRFGVGEHAGALGIRIVGVVEDSLYAGPRTGLQPSAFFSFTQANFPVEATFYVRARTESAALFPVLRKVVAGLDRSIPIVRDEDRGATARRHVELRAAHRFALGRVRGAGDDNGGARAVWCDVVRCREAHRGRSACDRARRRIVDVVRMVMGEIAILAGSGLLVGLPCAYGLSRLASSQLLDMPAVDGVTAGAAALVLVTVAAISGFVPARRACAIEPLKALRHE